MISLRKKLFTACQMSLSKKFCTNAAKNKVEGVCDISGKRALGQPASHTHPHLIGENEVTPLIKRDEFQCRRQKLVEAIAEHARKSNSSAENHIVKVLKDYLQQKILLTTYYAKFYSVLRHGIICWTGEGAVRCSEVFVIQKRVMNFARYESERLAEIIIPATSKQYMSDKIPYVFRQNTEFLYLTGCQEPDTCVVITTSNCPSDHKTTLFTRDKDDHAELWDGPRTHPEDAIGFFGVDNSLSMNDLPKFLNSCRRSLSNVQLWYDFESAPHREIHRIVCDYIKDSSSKSFESPRNFIHNLRLYKSPAEIALIQRSCDIASKAIVETMAYSRPGIGESQLFAKVDYECRVRGAEFLAYPPVVAGGSRATTIHYINNNQLIYNNEMVLMDAGCEYHGYASDITRTWPVNGKFTSAQREIYEVVLDVQKELIELCGKMPTLDTLFEWMCLLLGKRMQEIGILGIQPSNNYLIKAAYQLCPHHVSHYLGMDVHDTPSISRNLQIEPGMVITIEPGIYISEKSKLPKQYHGIGVRIEDDILITVNGPVVLSRRSPKEISDIEEIVCEGLSNKN